MCWGKGWHPLRKESEEMGKWITLKEVFNKSSILLRYLLRDPMLYIGLFFSPWKQVEFLSGWYAPGPGVLKLVSS